MGVTDELLKLKQLLDANAITQEEFDSMKAKLLSKKDENPSPNSSSLNTSRVGGYVQTGPSYNNGNYKSTPQATNRQNLRHYTYFNAKPFMVVGIICFIVAIFFVLCELIMVGTKNFESAFYITWEFTSLPASIALVMGIILKVKDDRKSILIMGIIALAISFIMSIVVTTSYYDYINDIMYGYY